MYEVFDELRKKKGVNVSTVSREAGVPLSTLTDWKAGRYTPKLDKMQKIADYFGVTVDYLTSGQDIKEVYYESESTAEIAQEIFENPDLRVLFDAARDADPEDLKTTYDMLMALKRKERGDDDDPA